MSKFTKTQKILFDQLQGHCTSYIESEEQGIIVNGLDVDSFIEECSKLLQANDTNTNGSGLNLQRVSESLLEKYIEHVGQCEGVTFVSKCNDEHSSDVKFSDEEIKILERLS